MVKLERNAELSQRLGRNFLWPGVELDYRVTHHIVQSRREGCTAEGALDFQNVVSGRGPVRVTSESAMKASNNFLACFLLAITAGGQLDAASAENSPSTLKELTGLWAPSKAGCEAILSKEPPPRSVAKHFGVIGICSNGLEMVYQPVSCSARDLGNKSNVISIAAACRTKDYEPIPLRIRISVKNPNVISFSEEDFDTNQFSLEGAYRRCNHTYQCVSRSNTGGRTDPRDQQANREIARAPTAPQQSETPLPPTNTLNEYFGTWVDAAQYTCRSFDESEGEWFRLSDGLLQEGYGNACNVKMTLDGPTLIAEGNECFGEEAPPAHIKRSFTLSEGGIIISNNVVYIKCGRNGR
jgi:hypothetical protein